MNVLILKGKAKEKKPISRSHQRSLQNAEISQFIEEIPKYLHATVPIVQAFYNHNNNKEKKRKK